MLKFGGYHPVWGYFDYGVTDENYPRSFDMEVGGASNAGCGVPNAFDTNGTNVWAGMSAGDIYAIMTFEHPLRIIGLSMTLSTEYGADFGFYGVPEGEDPVSEGILLG